MHEEKIKKIEKIEDKLLEGLCARMEMGLEMVETEEAGAVVDMIKDLADTKKNIWKACYYENQVKDDEMWGRYDNDRMGYDRYRYSNGRFAPTGRGHISGYIPPMPSEWRLDDDYSGRMGYRGENSGGNNRGGSSSNSQSGNNNGGGSGSSRYGRSYNSYRDSRRHYTETHSPEHKQQMDMHAKEHMDDTMETLRDMWKESDPELRQRMKSDISRLMGEMNM